MTVIDPETTNRELVFAGTSEEERGAAREQTSHVLERVREILGYDPIEEQLIAEGYREYGAEAIYLAESTLGVTLESLKADDEDSSE